PNLPKFTVLRKVSGKPFAKVDVVGDVIDSSSPPSTMRPLLSAILGCAVENLPGRNWVFGRGTVSGRYIKQTRFEPGKTRTVYGHWYPGGETITTHRCGRLSTSS